MRTESYYIEKEVNCINCGKVYISAEDSEIKEKLRVPFLMANNFCSRNCKENMDSYLETQKTDKIIK